MKIKINRTIELRDYEITALRSRYDDDGIDPADETFRQWVRSNFETCATAWLDELVTREMNK